MHKTYSQARRAVGQHNEWHMARFVHQGQGSQRPCTSFDPSLPNEASPWYCSKNGDVMMDDDGNGCGYGHGHDGDGHAIANRGYRNDSAHEVPVLFSPSEPYLLLSSHH